MTLARVQNAIADLVRRKLWIVWSALILHTIWAVALLAHGGEIRTTTMALLVDLLPNPYLLGVVLAAVAASALGGLLISVDNHRWRAAQLLLIPQQAVLCLSAGSALRAMIEGSFADGVGRPRPFIVADQSWAVLLALAHFAVILSCSMWDADRRHTSE